MKWHRVWGWINNSPLLALFCCICGTFFAVWYRLDHIEFVQVYSDSLSPFAAAIKAYNTGWSNPPNPESDHWLWFLMYPLVLFSNNLEQLFTIRLALGAIVVPVSCAILWLLKVQNKNLGIFLISILVSLDSGLIDTLLSSFRGYGAPELFAIATVGYLLWVRGFVIGAIVAGSTTIIAAGQHPLALGCLLSVFWMFVELNRISRRYLLVAVGACALVSLPRLLWVSQILQCDAGGLACIQEIAFSSSEQQLSLGLLWQVLHDRFWVEQGIGGLFLVVGCFLAPKNPLAKWVLLSALGISILGLSISTLRPYHFRVLAVPMLCWSVVGWSNFPKLLCMVSPFWVWGYLVQPPEPVEWRNNIKEHDQLAEAICTRPDAVWIEGYHPLADLQVSLQGIGISMALQGCKSKILSTPSEQQVLLLSNTSLSYPIFTEIGGNKIYEVSLKEMEVYSAQTLHSGFDVATLFFDDEDIVLRW
jgi:hypothetical protein